MHLSGESSTDAPSDTSSEYIDAFGATHVGNARETNEDHFLVAALHKTITLRYLSLPKSSVTGRVLGAKAYLLVVADGVGSLGGGEVASSSAVESLIEYVAQAANFCFGFDVVQEDDFVEHLERAVHTAHEALQEQFGSSGSGPATTLTLTVIVGDRSYVIHVGDSRCYLLSQGRLRQVTRDQTMAELLVDEGVMSETEARTSGLDHVLTGAVGHDVAPTVSVIDLDPGDVILLCTDGLTKHVSDDAIAAMLQRDDPAKVIVGDLIESALAGGGSDNVTAVVGRMLRSGE